MTATNTYPDGREGVGVADPGADPSGRTAPRLERIFVCYIPGMDARRVGADWTPFLHGLSADNPRVGIRTLPNTELLPSLVTGVWPHEHGIWQVSLRDEARLPSRRRLLDRVPDSLVTAAQCVRQYRDPSYDLASIPDRRRRRFDLHRFKYTRRQESDEPLRAFGPVPSVFGLLGARSRYLFTKRFDTLPSLAEELPSGRYDLEFLEMYALDLFQHWNLDRPAAMREAYSAADAFVRRVHARCRTTGTTLLVLVDHGQEAVVGTIPLRQALRSTRLSQSEYSYFAELALARFWFHTDRARDRLVDRLRALEHTTLLSWHDMHDYNVCFENDAHGELYLAADAGWIFFPHDFYQPLGNLFLGLSDRNQRRRVFGARHRGNHGYLPHFPSEKGWAVLADPRFRALRDEVQLIDFAPSVLSLLGRPRPEHMKGHAAFGV